MLSQVVLHGFSSHEQCWLELRELRGLGLIVGVELDVEMIDDRLCCAGSIQSSLEVDLVSLLANIEGQIVLDVPRKLARLTQALLLHLISNKVVVEANRVIIASDSSLHAHYALLQDPKTALNGGFALSTEFCGFAFSSVELLNSTRVQQKQIFWIPMESTIEGLIEYLKKGRGETKVFYLLDQSLPAIGEHSSIVKRFTEDASKMIREGLSMPIPLGSKELILKVSKNCRNVF